MDSMLSITAPGFMFFLLIFCVGYIAVGSVGSIKRKGSLERSIYYILSGVGINLVFLFVFSKIKDLVNFIDAFIVASKNQTINANDIINIVLFFLAYFIILVIFVCFVKWALKWLSKILRTK